MRLNLVVWLALSLVEFFGVLAFAGSSETGFTQADKDRMIRIEATLQTYMQQNDKRLSDMQASIDKRLSDTQASMDKRLSDMQAASDMCFEQIDKRLEFMQNLMIGMLAVFGSLCGVFVGLLL